MKKRNLMFRGHATDVKYMAFTAIKGVIINASHKSSTNKILPYKLNIHLR